MTRSEPDFEDSAFSPLAFLELSSLNLSIAIDTAAQEIYSAWLPKLEQGVSALWPSFQTIAGEEGVFDILGIDYARQSASLELTWTGNEAMHQLNREYRQKDSATDVLSFTLLADSPDLSMWLTLPQVQLGSIFISLDWAVAAQMQANTGNDSGLEAIAVSAQRLNSMPYPAEDLTDPLYCYIMERVLHGWLHLHGRHHDTMPDFEKVVRIQQRVLEAAFGPTSSVLPAKG